MREDIENCLKRKGKTLREKIVPIHTWLHLYVDAGIWEGCEWRVNVRECDGNVMGTWCDVILLFSQTTVTKLKTIPS